MLRAETFWISLAEVILVISLSYSLPALPVPMFVIVIAILVDIVIMSSSYLQGKRLEKYGKINT